MASPGNQPPSRPAQRDAASPPVNGGIPGLVPAEELYSVDAERAALGGAIISGLAVLTLLDLLTRDDFYFEAHRRLFDAAEYLVHQGQNPDVLTLPEELQRRGQLESVGGVLYLNVLVESVPTAAHAEYYCKLVAGKALLRRLVEAQAEISGLIADAEYEPDEIVSKAQNRILDLGRRSGGSEFQKLSALTIEQMERLHRVTAEANALSGTPTGFSRLDQMTGGLQNGDLVIVAGRPSLGKTALALAISIHAARQGYPGALFSIEMSAEQVANRLICAEGRIDAVRLRTGWLSRTVDALGLDETDRLGQATGMLGDLPLYVNDDSIITVPKMRAKCRRLKSQLGGSLGFVVVDYLQLVTGTGRNENRVNEVGAIARGLKTLAREINCPVIALSQLSRNVERRDDKRPVMSDLRESGDVEASADLVAMLYRESYYKRREDPAAADDSRDETELIIAKHRNGPVGTLKVGFWRKYARFEELETERDPADYGE